MPIQASNGYWENNEDRKTKNTNKPNGRTSLILIFLEFFGSKMIPNIIKQINIRYLIKIVCGHEFGTIISGKINKTINNNGTCKLCNLLSCRFFFMTITYLRLYNLTIMYFLGHSQGVYTNKIKQ